MSVGVRSATQIWRSRHPRTGRDHAITLYMAVMVLAVSVVPVARVVWLGATSSDSIALLTARSAPQAAGLIVVTLWAAALLIGRHRGPALRPPLLTHVFATSDRPRSETFRSPLLASGSVLVVSTGAVCAVIGAALAHHGATSVAGAAAFAASGLIVGALATTAWLAGQAFPRAAVPVALGILTLGGASVVSRPLLPLTPWGWVGLTYPGDGAPYALVGLGALAVGTLATAPALLNRLETAGLIEQSTTWDSSRSSATGLELDAASAAYRGLPHAGRRLNAVHATVHRSWTFLVRDAIGAFRTPGRLVAGLASLAAAGALLAIATSWAGPPWLLGAAAGILAFAGLSSVTDGVRHAASVASDLPLYGIGDAHLLADHTLFPLATALVVVLLAALVWSITGPEAGLGVGAASLSAITLALLSVSVRIVTALKGPLPPLLLTPVSTPAGDPMVLVRLAWALDGLLLAVACGVAAADPLASPAVPALLAAAVVGIGVIRWRSRR